MGANFEKEYDVTVNLVWMLRLLKVIKFEQAMDIANTITARNRRDV